VERAADVNDLIERAEAIRAELQELVRPKRRHLGLWIAAGVGALLIGVAAIVSRVPRIPD
jgi:hypothetical protein